jgi:hypothetical protein
MGGILSAEILLLTPNPPQPGKAFRHRIVGAINFDVPFLGMHPGVISTGIASIFSSPPDHPGTPEKTDIESTLISPTGTVGSQESSQAGGPLRQDTLFNPPPDPNYNPKFSNDVVLPVRKGWRSALHFVNKHSDGLRQATKQYVKSHIEFGGAMADYPGLKARYRRVRALEDEDDGTRKRVLELQIPPPRIRFINYYTASTGRPKKPRSKSRSRSRSRSGSRSRGNSRAQSPATTSASMAVPETGPHSMHSRSPSRSPRISIEEYRDDGTVEMAHIDPVPASSDEEDIPAPEAEGTEKSETSTGSDSDDDHKPLSSVKTGSSLSESTVNNILPDHFHVQMPNLPPIPPPPTEPPALDLTPYPDKSARKIVQKDHDRQVKIFKQAMKDRDSAIKDRAKLEAKMRKAAAKDILKKQKEEEKQKSKSSEEEEKKNNKALDEEEAKNTKTEEEKRVKAAEEKTSRKGKQKEQVSNETASPVQPEDPSSIQKNFTSSARGNTILSPPPSSSVSNFSLERSQTVDSYATTATGDGERKLEKKKKDRVFCMLPPKSPAGERDPAWVRIYMEGVDEVGAHCGLFFVSETYERLVGDVAGRIEEWLKEDMTKRFLEEAAGH